MNSLQKRFSTQKFTCFEIITLSILGCDQQNLENCLSDFKWFGHMLAHVHYFCTTKTLSKRWCTCYTGNKTDFSRENLRWGWVFLERTRILSGIQFTTHFIEIFVVETKRFVGSTLNVIMTRQTCGQRSSRAMESKRRALGNYFPD